MAIFKKQGVWWIDFYVCGKRKRERIGHSHKLAEEVLYKRKLEIAEGKYFPERQGNQSTFAEIAGTFLAQYAKHKKSAATLTLRTNRLIGVFGNYKLSSITPLMVKEMRNKIKETSTIATANRYQAVLRSIFNRAKDWKLFYGENPAAVEKLEKEAPNRLRYLSTEEIPLLLAACSREIYPVVVCALLTGMRRGEILGLKWDDVDLTERIIYLTETKSGKPREIPIMQKLYDSLIDMPRDGAFVFNVTKITLRSRFETALKQAGITGFRFHDLRHTFASHFIMRTSALPALQKILGHSTPLLTQRYAHLSNKHLRVNMELLDAEWTPIWTPSPAEILPAFPKNANISNGVTQ